jgi:glycosyltransferase involved in cell wall biosynthesis
MKKILHVSNWYPNKWNDLEALFVREQFRLFSRAAKESKMLHVQVMESDGWLRYERIRYSENETGYYLHTKIRTHRILEVLSTLLLLWALKREGAERYDLLHFHIAYPLLTWRHLWKRLFPTPLILSEHWSAYHYNFYMPPETRKLDRIKRIFRQGIPLLTVSRALLRDIRRFAGTDDFPAAVIPNVIDLDTYRHIESYRTKSGIPTFFIVNLWRDIKNPWPMLDAFAVLAEEGAAFELRIGGYGPILPEMRRYVREKGLDSRVTFLGKLYRERIAEEMNRADAYLFASSYETFSAVCAQALCCGCPLIGPTLEAVAEYTPPEAWVVAERNDPEGWHQALKKFLRRRESFDRRKIALRIRDYLGHDRILSLYQEFLR